MQIEGRRFSLAPQFYDGIKEGMTRRPMFFTSSVFIQHF